MSWEFVTEVRDFYGGLGFTVVAMFIGSMLYEQLNNKGKSNAQQRGEEVPRKTQLAGKPVDDFSEGDVEMVVNPLQRPKRVASRGQLPKEKAKLGKRNKKLAAMFKTGFESISFYMTLDVLKTLLFNGMVFAYICVYLYMLSASFGYSIFRTEVDQYFE